MVTKVVVVPHGLYTLQNAYNELLQTFFTNKWYKGHHNITPNSRRAIFIPLRFTIQNIKNRYETIFIYKLFITWASHFYTV